jgi:hypothetical protein
MSTDTQTIEIKKIIIEGITPEGKAFRPADWADRLCGALSEFKEQRMRYDDRLRPKTNQAGNRCIVIDPSLEESLPDIYREVMEFAKENSLKVCEEITHKIIDSEV